MKPSGAQQSLLIGVPLSVFKLFDLGTPKPAALLISQHAILFNLGSP